MSDEASQLKTQQQLPPPAQEDDAAKSDAAHDVAASVLPDWVKRLRFFGDFRYRNEWVGDETQTDERDRNRIHMRVGLSATINEELDVVLGLASGNNAAPVSREEAGSPTSTNQDLDDAFSRKNIWLDLAHFDYHPAGIKGMNVLAGKMKNPFFTPGKSDLMLDRDVTPEGGVLLHKITRDDDVTLFGAAGAFWVEERSMDADTSLWVIQGGVIVPIPHADKTALTIGGGYYDYGNVEGRPPLGLANSFFGNRSAGGAYESDFDIWQGFAELGFAVGGIPCTVFADVLHNAAASSSEDSGYYAGFTVGNCSKPGTWRSAYSYRDLDADAVLGVLTEATFAGGGTNVRGHIFSFGYQLLKDWQFVASYMPAERTNTATGITTDHHTVLLDLVARF
ncbi:MAG: putative porin [Phycisphaerales bacterium]